MTAFIWATISFDTFSFIPFAVSESIYVTLESVNVNSSFNAGVPLSASIESEQSVVLAYFSLLLEESVVHGTHTYWSSLPAV